MKKLFVAMGLMLVLGTDWQAFAQNNAPPQIVARRFYVNGFLADTPALPAVASLDLEELDEVRMEVDVLLSDDTADPNQQNDQEVKLYYEKLSVWIPFAYYLSPEGPPVGRDTMENEFLTPDRLTPLDVNLYRLTIDFVVPEFTGVNQARLRGYIDYDVRYLVRLRAWDAETAAEEDPVPGFNFIMYVVADPSLEPPNPPPFADAGADQTVLVGSTVDLDGSETFDSFNLGFNPGDTEIFYKDTVVYSWEQLTGPSLVMPFYPDPTDQPWLARVKLDVPTTPDNLYSFRLLVDDGVTTLPSLATVKVAVLSSLPVNHAPVAVIVGPANPVPVGGIVTLDGRLSSDSDLDKLYYRWQQTDEVGGDLPASDLSSMFQPVGGLDSATVSWQALRVGTYYFRLTVYDRETFTEALYATVATQVQIVAATTSTGGNNNTGGSQTTTDPNGTTSDPNGTGDTNPTAACGAGLLPLALLPLCLWLLRGRIR